MATQEQINQIAIDNRTFINSLIANSKLPSELASKSSITDSSDVSVVQNGLSDAEKVDIALTRGSLGDWSALTNDPSLVNGTGIGGDKYIVSVAGTQDFGDGDITFSVDDFVEYQSGKWVQGLNTEIGAKALVNVIEVNSPDDFPAAVSGVRELSQPGINLVYQICSARMDMGTDLFTCTSGNVTIKGVNVFGSALSTTGVGNFFTTVDSSLVFDSILWDCPNATIVDFSVPTASTISFLSLNCIVINCDKIFNIDGAFTSSIKALTVFATQTGGMLWTNAQNQLDIEGLLGNSWAGTLIDLGTATFNLGLIAAGRYISPVGTTILDGAAGSANLNAGARFIVGSNLFNGLGTSVATIDTEDLQFRFNDNIFADNSTKNTEVVTDAYLSASTTVTIGTIGVYVAVGGVNWVSDIAKRFTVSTAGLLTYIGLETVDVTIVAVSTVEKVGGGSDVVCSKIAINGTVSEKTIACTENASPTGITSIGLFEIATGDTIQLFMGNEGSTADIEVSTSTIIIRQR